MVNTAFTKAAAERRMMLSYAASDVRDALAALLALDDVLGGLLRGGRDPIVQQMRLTWWHGALTALDHAPPPAEPVLQALGRHVVPRAAGARLAEMVEGWEELTDPDPLDEGRLSRYADGRGGALFAIAGTILGAAADDPLDDAGRGWALADLATNVGDPGARFIAASLASEHLARATATSWSRQVRALGAMAHLAAMPNASPPARVGRALWHRLTGR